MASAIKRRRGTTAQHSTFIGQIAELTVNTDTKLLHVHDGVRAKGYPTDYVANAIRSGAWGDGIHDDYAALQVAINAAVAAGKRLNVPAGTYLVSQPLVIPTGATEWGFEIVGAKSESKYQYLPGSASTIIRASAVMAFVVTSSGAYYASLRNLVIDANLLAAVGYKSGYQDRLVNCSVIQATTAGVDLSGQTNSTRITECTLALNVIGLRSVGVDTTTFYVNRCQIRENTGDGIYMTNGFTVRFSECIIEQNAGIGAHLKAAASATVQLWNVVFDQCWFEGNTGYCTDIGGLGASPAKYIKFRDCFFNAGAKCANIGFVYGATFEACHFLESVTTAGYFVVANTALYVSIIDQPDVLGDAAIAITGAGAGIVTKFSAHLDGYYKMTQPLVAKGLPTAIAVPAGYVGEVISAEVLSAAAVNLTNATIANVASVVLTPGRWKITATLSFKQNAATTYVALVGYISTLIAGGGSNKETVQTAWGCSANTDGSLSFTPLYLDVPAGANVTRYLNALAYFAVNTMKAYGHIQAERYA